MSVAFPYTLMFWMSSRQGVSTYCWSTGSDLSIWHRAQKLRIGSYSAGWRRSPHWGITEHKYTSIRLVSNICLICQKLWTYITVCCYNIIYIVMFRSVKSLKTSKLSSKSKHKQAIYILNASNLSGLGGREDMAAVWQSEDCGFDSRC